MKRNSTPAFTTVRLRSKYGDNGGEYFIDPSDAKGMARVKKDLKSAQDEEPNFDWHLETRGTHAGWHRWRENPVRRTKRNSGQSYTIAFQGKHRGAIGHPENFTVTVQATSPKAAIIKLYDKYDHIHLPKIVHGGKTFRIPRNNPKKKNPRRRPSTRRVSRAWWRTRSIKGFKNLNRALARRSKKLKSRRRK